MAVRFCLLFVGMLISLSSAFAQTYSSSPVNSDTSYKSDPLFSTDSSEIIDSAVALGQNYPNPFSLSTDFRFQIIDQSLIGKTVNVSVFDMQGNKVKTLYENSADAAVHTLTFNAGGLRTGRYTCRLRCGEHQAVRLMSVIGQQ
ncbi:MAG TPA: T9SS type A sorting domain-containing protein [Candidatus Kapabacteria bacterium]|nr:T9SS type A sorting domain-containing protein [Candidatus Kapabacteria bacterium]